MKAKEDTVRVWVGLDLLQAQMMKQMLIDNGIECLADRDRGVIPAGEFGEIGLWVSHTDEGRARKLLEKMEEEMSAELDEEPPEPE
ncbi:MAG TPA: DUF2007 domain-containing protein [Candidatus Acidoferrales bacterium]|nr:DUF2007 domain-containing protein [Candidatus Acidoferrales bacterium]